MNANPQEIITELNNVLAQAELERMLAIEHLFSILDGDDEQVAKDEARTWLKEKYGESYAMLSSIARRVYQTGNAVEWPDELDA